MTIFSPRRDLGEFRRRYKWMVLGALVSFAFLWGRAVQLQVIDHAEHVAIAEDNVTRTIVIPATRGLLYDTAGRVLARNEPSYSVLVTPQLMDGREGMARLSRFMGLSRAEEEDLKRKLEDVPEERREHQLELFSEVTRDVVAVLETHSEELLGVDVVMKPVRSYPFGELAAHAIGYLSEVNADDLVSHGNQGYQAGDWIGRVGVERAWEGYLRGQSGFRRVRIDSRRNRAEVSAAENSETRRDPVPGRDLTLTLDMELNRIIERAFSAQPSGAAVVVDVRSGRVRALFSKPAFDLNEMTGRLTAARFHELEENILRPLIDKTVFESYYPGSTFKPITALAALGEGLDPSDHVDCPGFYEIGNRRFRCTQAHGEVDMGQAIVQSCNVYFWRLAERVGLDRLAHVATDFGLGERSGIGINSETPGFIPTREWHSRQRGEQFRVGFTLNTAIGQGNTRVNVVQLAMMYAAIANGGVLYVPQLVERISAPDGATAETFEPRARRRVHAAPEHLSYVIDGLYGVVNDPKGTAHDPRSVGTIAIAGKTGTAQVSKVNPSGTLSAERAAFLSRDHAWFAGFAPAGDPSIAMVVLVEHGGAGGRTAAPIALQIVREFLRGRGPSHAGTQ